MHTHVHTYTHRYTHYMVYTLHGIHTTWYTHYMVYTLHGIHTTWYTHYMVYTLHGIHTTWYTHYMVYTTSEIISNPLPSCLSFHLPTPPLPSLPNPPPSLPSPPPLPSPPLPSPPPPLPLSSSPAQGNYYNMSIDLTCDSSGKECLPEIIADEYWIKVGSPHPGIGTSCGHYMYIITCAPEPTAIHVLLLALSSCKSHLASLADMAIC